MFISITTIEDGGNYYNEHNYYEYEITSDAKIINMSIYMSEENFYQDGADETEFYIASRTLRFNYNGVDADLKNKLEIAKTTTVE